jgi:hypothetical protein
MLRVTHAQLYEYGLCRLIGGGGAHGMWRLDNAGCCCP